VVNWESIAKERGHETPKAMLEKLYLEEGYTMVDIAALIGCSSWSVGRALNYFGIERHRHGGARRSKGKPSISQIESVLQKLTKEVK